MTFRFHRWIARSAAVLAALACTATHAQPDTYPNRPIRVIVPSAPGGPADIIVRTIENKVAAILGQPLVLEYRTGASGTIGLQLATRAAPDGYTLVFVSETHTAAESLYAKRGYSIKTDLAPVAVMVSQPRVLVVNNQLPVKTVQELLAMAREQPGKLSFASGGAGNVYHLAAALLQDKANLDLLHVPYSQAAMGRTDLVSGQIDMMFDAVGAILPQIQSGSVRPLAVTSRKRLDVLPHLPTLMEVGVEGYEFESISGLMAPAGTPAAIIDKINAAVNTALKDKTVQDSLRKAAMNPLTETPAQFGEWSNQSVDKWAGVIKAVGIKIE